MGLTDVPWAWSLKMSLSVLKPRVFPQTLRIRKNFVTPRGARLPSVLLTDFLLYRLSKFEACVIHVRLKKMQSQHEVFIGSVIRDTSTPWQTHYLPVPNPWFTCDNPVYLWAWTTWNWSSIVFQCCAWDGHWAVQHWFIDSKSTTCNKP